MCSCILNVPFQKFNFISPCIKFKLLITHLSFQIYYKMVRVCFAVLGAKFAHIIILLLLDKLIDYLILSC